MTGIKRAAGVAILIAMLMALMVPRLVRRSPSSIASVALGTDDAFSISGLEPRENLVGGGAIRWTRPRSFFRFDRLGSGDVLIELNVREHRGEVAITVNGARLGLLQRGQTRLESHAQATAAGLLIGIETDGFSTATRSLGTQFGSLVLTPQKPSVPASLWLAFGLVLLATVTIQVAAGLSAYFSILPTLILAALVLPAGLFRSAWLEIAASLVVLATVASALTARRAPGSIGQRTLLATALLLALTIHGLVPPSPLMVQGDAQFHGNRLEDVASGNLFITSQTQHHPPFKFPYGFSFYAVLAPFVSLGVSNVSLVRGGAALFCAASILALAFSFGRKSAALAAAVTALWAFAPVNIRHMGFGNLSNVFAQSVFVLFLVCALAPPPGALRRLLLSGLVALSAMSHLSSFIVMAALLLATLCFRVERGSSGTKPLLWGVLVSAAYYASFVPSILSSIPRLLSEPGGSAGVFDPFRLPHQILLELGWPLVLWLAMIVVSGRWKEAEIPLPFAKSQAVAGVALAVLGLASPVEVRYVLALTPLIVVVAACNLAEPKGVQRETFLEVFDFSIPGVLRSGKAIRIAGMGLVLLSVVHGAVVLRDFLPLWKDNPGLLH